MTQLFQSADHGLIQLTYFKHEFAAWIETLIWQYCCWFKSDGHHFENTAALVLLYLCNHALTWGDDRAFDWRAAVLSHFQESCSVVRQLQGGFLITRSVPESVVPCRPCINDRWCHGKPLQQVSADPSCTVILSLYCDLASHVNATRNIWLYELDVFVKLYPESWPGWVRPSSEWVRPGSGLFTAGRSYTALIKGSQHEAATEKHRMLFLLVDITHNTRELTPLLYVLFLAFVVFFSLIASTKDMLKILQW